MTLRKVLIAAVLCLLPLFCGIVFYFVKTRPEPSPVPLIQGQNGSLALSETFARGPIPEDVFCDRIIVQKSSRALTLYRGKEALKTYRIALGGNPLGHKEFEGDQKTPEGLYVISGRNPKSDFHLSLRISYPNTADQSHAQALGQSPGGDIMIHGLPNGSVGPTEIYRGRDWTAGCLAVNDGEIEELWRVIPDGTTIEIRP